MFWENQWRRRRGRFSSSWGGPWVRPEFRISSNLSTYIFDFLFFFLFSHRHCSGSFLCPQEYRKPSRRCDSKSLFSARLMYNVYDPYIFILIYCVWWFWRLNELEESLLWKGFSYVPTFWGEKEMMMFGEYDMSLRYGISQYCVRCLVVSQNTLWYCWKYCQTHDDLLNLCELDRSIYRYIYIYS